MIAHIRGQVVDRTSNSVIVDVSGVGYEVLVSTIDLERITLNETIKLHTFDHVRETSRELFGFFEAADMRLFEQLIGVNGIGPRMGLALMGLGEAKQIRSAIAGGNAAYLTNAPGVGKRVAERVIVELQDKMGSFEQIATNLQTGSNDAQSALEALGYSSSQAAMALAQLKPDLTTEEKVKSALKVLSS